MKTSAHSPQIWRGGYLLKRRDGADTVIRPARLLSAKSGHSRVTAVSIFEFISQRCPDRRDGGAAAVAAYRAAHHHFKHLLPDLRESRLLTPADLFAWRRWCQLASSLAFPAYLNIVFQLNILTWFPDKYCV